VITPSILTNLRITVAQEATSDCFRLRVVLQLTAMQKRSVELTDFTEPFGPRYSCALSYADGDGWIGLCAGPRGFRCEITGATAEECCEAAARRVVEHHGSEGCELSYEYTREAWTKACAEEAQSAKAQAAEAACPLCNEQHPEHEHAVCRATAYLN
jgi:hypothetical protein